VSEGLLVRVSRGTPVLFQNPVKQVRQIFEVDINFQDSLSVSPDGRWILYTQTDEINTDIMLVENFH
jgi:hypothetical protein